MHLDEDRLLLRGVYRGRGKKSGIEFDAALQPNLQR